MNAEIRRSLASQIMAEWDVGSDVAEWILRDEYRGWDKPERYHLCMISHFLTLPEVLERSAQALHGVRSTLPPGGLIAVVGAARQGGRYGPIYQEIRRQASGLHRLQASGVYRPRVDEESRERLRALNMRVRDRLIELGVDIGRAIADWPAGIAGLVLQRWKSDNQIVLPSYTLYIFRARHQQMMRRCRQRLQVRLP